MQPKINNFCYNLIRVAVTIKEKISLLIDKQVKGAGKQGRKTKAELTK